MDPRAIQLIPPNELTFFQPQATARLSALPVEILYMIFGLLTFRQRVLLTRVSKRLRDALCFWPGFAHTLSNEDGRHRLSQVLAPYMDRIRGSNVRCLSLLTRRSDMEGRAASTVELSKFMQLLGKYKCHSINEANIQMYCISRPQWMTRFIRLASQSLTTLTLLTAINPNELLSAIQFLLSGFPKLEYLSFGTRLSISPVVVWHPNSHTRQVFSPVIDVYNQIRNAAPWSIVVNTSLRQLSVDSDNGIGDYDRAFFSCIPNVRVLVFSGSIFLPSTDNVNVIYQDIRNHCRNIESVTYCHNSYALRQDQAADSEDIIRNIFVLNKFRVLKVIGRNLSVYTKQHTEAIVAAYHSEMTEMSIEPPDTGMVGYFAGFTFPRLEKVVIAFKNWPLYPEQEDPWIRIRQDIGWFLWLSYLPCLRHVELNRMDVISRDVHRLKNRYLLPNMQTLKLINCRYRLDMLRGEYLITEHYHEITTFNPVQ